MDMLGSNSTLFTNGSLILPDRLIEDGELTVSDGVIESVGPRRKRSHWPGRTIDLKGAWLAPGFVDLHVHGGGVGQAVARAQRQGAGVD
jgi:N-acetylglucosamine-6-phosphate deacetylase